VQRESLARLPTGAARVARAAAHRRSAIARMRLRLRHL